MRAKYFELLEALTGGGVDFIIVGGVPGKPWRANPGAVTGALR